MTTDSPKTHGDILSMSDEEFLATSMSVPERQEEVVEEEVVEVPESEEQEGDAVVEPEEEVELEDDPANPVGSETEEAEATEGEEPTKEEESSEGKAPSAPKIDYAQAGKDLLAPLTANGKTIEIQTAAEARQLMQMGANYTKKMQSIAPHRKVLMMLEKNELLDEDKLSLLIDIQKKDPSAIKKFLKDSGIDPLDIDTSEENTYQEGNHRVSDDEEAFRSTLEDLKSTPEGQETIQVIHTNWDQASKEVLWQSPEIMRAIQEQRATGMYDRISAEVDRRKSLGIIPPNAPFLHAYKAIGDELVAEHERNRAANTPVAKSIQKPRSGLTNSAKVSAASPTRSTPRKAEAFVNPLAMSDEEFSKLMSQKL